jgi:superfamily II DNA or RNA helicase
VANITIKPKNHVHCRVDADVGIMQELSDYFTFEQPGARFMPQYRAKLWDGKVRLYSMFTQELYAGLIPYVQAFAALNNYTVENTIPASPEPYVDVAQYLEDLKLMGHGKPIQIRDYQIDAVRHAIFSERSLLLSPTGSGKSLIIYGIMRHHLDQGRRQLILVPTTSLVEQLYADFQDYSSANGWRTSENVHRIYGGHEKLNSWPVVISTWQSLYKLPKSFFDGFDVVYGDEAHLFKAKSLTSILNKMPDCGYRIGTTGTLDGLQTHKLILEGIFGAVHKVTTTRQLIKNEQLADLDITVLTLEYPDAERKSSRAFTYQEEMDFLTGYEPRNRFIRNLALAQTGNTLVLFQYVEKHGKHLHQLISERAAEGRKIFFVYGGTDTDQREQVRHITESQADAIIVASYGTFSTGINIRNLHNIIFASPSKSRIRNLQSIGRGLRTSESKDRCKLFDLGDDLSWKTKKNFTLLHLAERIKIYNDEHFNYKLVKVQLNQCN